MKPLPPSTRWWLVSVLVLSMLAVLAAAAVYAYVQPYRLRAEQYDLKNLDHFNVTSIFYDRAGGEAGRLFLENRTVLRHEDIPEYMRKATVAVEDKRFYTHKGIDIQGVVRAVIVNLKTGERTQGASTITQQLAKNLNGQFEKTLERKLVEAFLAHRIEKYESKEEILDHYLNRIYFGRGNFGLAAAAKGYFGKEAKDLTVSECALLAGIIKAPNTYSPRNDAAAALRQRDRVLALMHAQGLLTDAESSAALGESVQLVPEAPLRQQSYFMAYAIRELRKVLNLEEGQDIPQGLTVRTTLDTQMQRTAESKVEEKIQETSAASSTAASEEAAKTDTLQAAAVVIDLQDGALRVLIGGRDFQQSSFDRARMARRENGALLQPFLYSLAIERLGLHPASMINASFLDQGAQLEEVGFGDPKRDLGKRFLMLQDALALSNKATATRVGLQLGVSTFGDWLISSGVDRNENEISGIPGPLTLFEITSLYQMLGNHGRQVKPHTIVSVVNDLGETLYRHPKDPGRPLLKPLVAQQMTLSMQSVTRDGTASLLTRNYNFPSSVVGMTGYSEGYRDAWFVGFTPSLAAGVWVGYDKPRPIGTKSAALNSALPIWGGMMQKILEQDPQGIAFPVPPELSKVEVERRTGVIQGLGFLSPGAGNQFVYLRQDQLNQAKAGAAATQIQQPKDWSNWLSTMFAYPTGDTPSVVPDGESPDDLAGEIPLVAEYRMPALRGDILAADGEVLATMLQSQSLVLAWPALEVANDDEAAVAWMQKRLVHAREWLHSAVDLTDADLLLLHRFRRFHPVVVSENLDPVLAGTFEKTNLPKEGFALQGIPLRTYPRGPFLSHTLGYLQRKKATSRRNYQADEVIYDEYEGATGLEEHFDKQLRGRDGHLTIATTLEGFTQTTVIDEAATPGSRLRTTIDARVQQAAEKAMDGIRSGAAVVMNPRNGDILAIVSRPTFDPNAFLPRLPPQQWEAFVQSAKNPLLDRSYRQDQPPGSAFKVVTTLAAMSAGVFDPNRAIPCPGYFNVGNMQYQLPREKGAPVSFQTAIARSYNTYFFDLGLRIGRDPFIRTAVELGLGRPTGYILPGESTGLIPVPEFVRATHKRSMGAGDLANMSIGQGDVLATPLQMASVMCVVANGGTLHRPRLAQQLEDATGKITQSFPTEVIHKIKLEPADAKVLVDGMVAVTENGTGSSARVPGIRVAAKSSTAQVGSKEKPRQIAWMVGFLPAENPHYAYAIMVEGDTDQDLHGGEDAGLIAGNMFREIYRSPTTASAPTPQTRP